MAALPLRREESLGLGLALLGHAALLVWLVWQRPAPPLPLPERMEVTISDETGLTAATPDQAEAARETGPVVGPAPPPPAVLIPLPVPVSAPVTMAQPPPAPAPIRQPRAVAPAPPKAAAKLAPSPLHHAPAKPGSAAFDNAFNSGIPAGKAGAAAQNAPAAVTGAVRSSLANEVARQLKRRWQGPNGLDVDKLVTTLEWDLDPDGSLAGAPRVLSQGGITPANQAQAGRHKEQAIKAVRLAAPFALPPQFYSAWHHLRFTFDWKINQ